MRMRVGMAIISLLALALGAAGKNPPHNDVFTAGPADETQLAQKIRHELLMLPYYSIFDDLSFKIDGSVVTLEGACPPEPPYDIHKDAENVVKRIAGVTQVVNNIKVLPPAPLDQEARVRVYRAIANTGSLSQYFWQAAPSIHIIVQGQRVTLKGYVHSETDQNLATIAARGVPDIFEVTNELRVVK